MRCFALVFWFCLGWHTMQAQHAVFRVQTPEQQYDSLNQFLYFLEDSSRELSLQNVQQMPFRKFVGATLHDNASVYWAKIQLRNELKSAQNFVLQIYGMENREYVQTYIFQDSVLIEAKKTGFFVPKSEKSELSRYKSWIPLRLLPNQTITVFIQAKGIYIVERANHFDLRLVTSDLAKAQLSDYRIEHHSINGFIIGILFILGVYHFLIFLINQTNLYFYYSTYILAVVGYLANAQQLIYEFDFFAQNPSIFHYIDKIALGLAFVLYAQFFRFFLQSAQHQPKLDKLVQWVIGLRLMTLLVSLVVIWQYEQIRYIATMNNLSLLCGVGIFLVGTLRHVWLYPRDSSGHFFLWGNGILILFTILSVVLVQLNFELVEIAHSMTKIGVILEALVFSLGLGDKIRRNDLEKQSIQEKLIEQLRENEALTRKHNTELEVKVKARTQELEHTNLSLQEAYKEVDIKNKNIIASINYAHRIQEAMLPVQEKINAFFPENFILFQPRDIVSGDFYWFYHKENIGILAVADCTGHGVPGAFMSMIGMSNLDKIVRDNAVISPEIILEKLHLNIRKSLKQAESSNRDGMDITIAVVNQKTKTLEFAGAKNPLIYFQEGKQFFIKGNRASIGGIQREKVRTFDKHTISFDVPTLIYMYSDGYIDQFGGAHRRKLMSKNFKDILDHIHMLPMDRQYVRLRDLHLKWRRQGGNPQTDDIIVVGIYLK